MGHNRNELGFFDYSIPTFLENNVTISNKDIVIELVAGSFTLDYNILFHNHNVIIKGAGQGITILNINENIDCYGDSLICLKGEAGDEISVSVSDLTIQSNVTQLQANQRNYKLTQDESFLIKCYHVKSFKMRNVTINVQNIETTCLNVRRGYNIEISECTFINYNRRWTGGGIWLQGDLENITIEDNDFYKYGNDEVIGIWGSNNFVGTNDADEINKKNINICYNRIYCQDENGGENTSSIIDENSEDWEGNCQRFITIYTSQRDNVELVNENHVQRSTPCLYTVNGIHIMNNEITINAPIDYLFTIAFDKYTEFKDISIRNNIINYGSWLVTGDTPGSKGVEDFNIGYDTTFGSSNIPGGYDQTSHEAFLIEGNTITCGCNVRNTHTYNNEPCYVDCHRCLEINGVDVLFNKNRILYTRDTFTEDEGSNANKGIELFRYRGKGGSVIFNDNRCEGLKLLLYAFGINATDRAIPLVRLYGRGNCLYGNTRMSYNYVIESHVSLIGNEFISDYQLFLISEYANTGTVVFTGNRVYREMSRNTNYSVPKGQIFYTGKDDSTSNIDSMGFVCCDNIFENLIYSGSMYYDFQKVSAIKVIHKDNIFSDTNE